MAALCAADMAMIDRGTAAALERRRSAAVHALLLDPLTAACCTPSEITSMVDELFDAEAAFLPGFTP